MLLEANYKVTEIGKLARDLIKLAQDFNIFLISGDLGAGKTTLVKELFTQLGIKETISSPTFTYLVSYKLDNGINIYHFDLYRFNNLDEFKSAGFEEYLYEPNSIVFIEWPELIEPILDDLKNRACFIEIEHISNAERIIKIALNNDFESKRNIANFDLLKICKKT